MMAHVYSVLALVALILVALLINSYVGVSKWLAPAGTTGSI